MHCNKSRPSSNVKVKGQGHQAQQTRLALPASPGAYEWYALAANSGRVWLSEGVVQSCRPTVLRRGENQRMLSSVISNFFSMFLVYV